VTTTSSNQSKTWVIGGALIVAAIGMAAWLFGRPTQDDALAVNDTPSEPASVPTAPKPPQTVASVQAKPAPAAPAAPKPATPPPAAANDDVDLFADAMPDFMVDIHARVLDKKWLGVEDQKKLYFYGKEHRDDARPQLLLAWDATNRDWDGMAITVYGTAFRADPRAKGEKNLRDLLELASKHDTERVEFTDATQIIKDSFGPDALPIIEDEVLKLEEKGQLARAARLSQMRDKIRQ
jgi:hypothetical protein